MHEFDAWVVVKLPENRGYKVFGSNAGGYTTGDNWRLNSGITRVEQDPTSTDHLLFHGYSGSTYRLHKKCYGVVGSYNASVLNKLEEKGVKVMNDHDWLKFNLEEKWS